MDNKDITCRIATGIMFGVMFAVVISLNGKLAEKVVANDEAITLASADANVLSEAIDGTAQALMAQAQRQEALRQAFVIERMVQQFVDEKPRRLTNDQLLLMVRSGRHAIVAEELDKRVKSGDLVLPKPTPAKPQPEKK